MRRVSDRLLVVVALGGLFGLAALAGPWPTSSAGDSASARGAHLARTLPCGASDAPEPSIFDTWFCNWLVGFVGPPTGPFGPDTGHVTFTRISQDEGNAAANQDFGVFPFHAYVCDRSRLYYRGRFDWGGGGDIIACTVNNGHGLEGRYKLDNILDSGCCGLMQSGDVSLTSGSGIDFTGSYDVDNSNQPAFQWTGHYLGGGFKRQKKSPPKRKPPAKKKAPGCNPPHKHRKAPPCHWVVSFHMSQRGLPYDPAPPPDLAADDTTAVGRIFFKSRPREGRITIGSPAGGALFSADYVEATLQTTTDSFTGKLNVAGAFKYTAHERELAASGPIGDVQTRAGSKLAGCKNKGGHVVMGMVDAKRTADSFRLKVVCHKPSATVKDARYANDGTDKLRVTISQPKRL